MKFFSWARADVRAVSGAVFGAAIVVVAGTVALGARPAEERRAAPPASTPVAAVSTEATAPIPAGSQTPSPEFMGGVILQRVNDVAGPAMPSYNAAGDSRTLECLSTAVYYEARGEGADGMAAVAQVILNRSRHPLFPRSVCGVVYQASQFSFVGARNRAPYGRLWEQAREIAERALSGEVMSRVGTATHFHATRVRPSWPGMRRVATIGQHVFYAYSGSRGTPSAFIRGPEREYARPPRNENVYAMLPSEQPGVKPPEVSTVVRPPAALSAAAPAAPAAAETATAPAPAGPEVIAPLRTITLAPVASPVA